jgi:hypothetical protein
MKAKNLPKNAFNTQSNVLVVICSFIILILFNGCSIAGLVIGSKIKSKKSKELQVPGYDFSKITHNKQITVMLNNSDSILGNYKDNEITKLEEYKEVYDAKIAKLDLDFKLPRIGDTLYLNIIHGYNFNQDKGLTYPFIFEGFDHKSIMLKKEKDALVKQYLLNNISYSQTNIDKIEELIKSRMIPTRRTLIVKTQNEVQNIRSSDIQYIKYKKRKSNELIGFLVGLGIDYFILTKIAKEHGKWVW